jgi:hypothetical protein
MDTEVKKAKVKAKLRGEMCQNCMLGKPFMDRRRVKFLVKCTKHKHNKKLHEWCRFYQARPEYETRRPRMFG